VAEAAVLVVEAAADVKVEKLLVVKFDHQAAVQTFKRSELLRATFKRSNSD
jgi:hypothetical protein